MNVPDNYYDWDDVNPEYVHIDTHEDIVGDLQAKIENAKIEMIKLQWAILTGDLKKIQEAYEDAYEYLEG